MVNQKQNENISNSQNIRKYHKMQTKVLPFKTVIVIVITKNIKKLKILQNKRF